MRISGPLIRDAAGDHNTVTVAHPPGARLVASVLALTVTITVTLAAYVYAGAPYVTMALLTSTMALAGWLSTKRAQVADLPVAFNLLISTLVALTVLYGEEWYRHFPSTLMRYFPASYPDGVGLGEHGFVAVFPLAVAPLMTLGAFAYYRRSVLGDIAAWAVFSWACVAAVAVYVVGPLAGQSMHYVGGMIAAPVVFALGVLGIVRLARSSARTLA
jgi:hypothetical protein